MRFIMNQSPLILIATNRYSLSKSYYRVQTFTDAQKIQTFKNTINRLILMK